MKLRAISASPHLEHCKSFVRRLRNTSVKKRTFWLIILAVVTLLFALGQSKITEEANRPLGPTLPPPQPSQTSVPPLVPDAMSAIAPEATPDPTPKPLCGGPEQMTILGAGIDKQSIDYDSVGRVDVIRIIHVDFVRGSINILTVPRDLWVEIPGLEGHTHPEGYFGYPIVEGEVLDQQGDYGRINASYFYGEYYDLPGGGPAILAQTLYQNFGLPIDHYAIADMGTFSEAIDAIGGIDLYVPEQLGNYTVGWHHMDGPTALYYTRIRYPDTDWNRIDRQSQVLLALGEQALEPENISSMPALINSFLDDILTDLSKAEIASLSCLASKISREQITTYRIGPEMVASVGTTHGSSVMLPDSEAISVLIDEFLRGQEESQTSKSP